MLRLITGQSPLNGASQLRVGLFTDTLDEINGVGRFIRDMGEQARAKDRHFIIHTCVKKTRFDLPNRKNFDPMLSRSLPYYPELEMNLPPFPEILDWADRQQFDAIHVSTPGAMGLCGLAVAKMLRVPVLGTYHTDFPAYVDNIVGDHRITAGTTVYMKWLYARMKTVFSRSREYQNSLRKLGVTDDRLAVTLPGINTDKFNPKHRDVNLWATRGIGETYKLMYCGRVSLEKNLPLLADAFKKLCAIRRDTALVIAGEGPYFPKMKQELAGLPAYFLGYQNDQQLGPLYASADLFVFPSLTDTLGQVVMESQASGLPVLVSDVGGPKEMMDDGVTGLVLPASTPVTDAATWCSSINDLLNDDPRRQRMARTAPGRINRFSLEKTFEAFWAEHETACRETAVPRQTPAPAEPVAV